MLEKIIRWFFIARAYVLSLPFVTISMIISRIKHESDEEYIRRAIRMIPRFVKYDLTDDDLIDEYITKYL